MLVQFWQFVRPRTKQVKSISAVHLKKSIILKSVEKVIFLTLF